MGSEHLPDMPDGYVSIGTWKRSHTTIVETHYQWEEDLPYASFTCDACPQPHKTHWLARESKAWTTRCTECARKHQAYKRVRRMRELFMAKKPVGATAVAITLTFGDDQIDKTQPVTDLKKQTMRRFKRLRERSEWWQSHFSGGVSSFECTENAERGTYHPHLHIVAWTDMQYPYPIDAFRAEMLKHGFGWAKSKIESAYTKKPVTDNNGTWLRDKDGKVITYKTYEDPAGAIWYAMKYTLKESVLGEKKGRTITKFGDLYGTKWSVDLKPPKNEVVERLFADSTYTFMKPEYRLSGRW